MCGKTLNDVVTYVRETTLSEDPRAEIGFDCYCEHCGWSGDIEPDWLPWEKLLKVLKKIKEMEASKKSGKRGLMDNGRRNSYVEDVA